MQLAQTLSANLKRGVVSALLATALGNDLASTLVQELSNVFFLKTELERVAAVLNTLDDQFSTNNIKSKWKLGVDILVTHQLAAHTT